MPATTRHADRDRHQPAAARPGRGVQAERRRQRQRGGARPGCRPVRPIAASSPSTAVNSRGRVQPRQASTPSSRRRPRIAADAELATNSTQTTRISANSTRLFSSTAREDRDRDAFLHPVLSQGQGGLAELPRGQGRSWSAPARIRDDVDHRGACGPRSAAPTSRIRSSDTGFGPVTPATRIADSADRVGYRQAELTSSRSPHSAGRADSEVIRSTGWLIIAAQILARQQVTDAPRAARLTALAGSAAVTGW